MSSRGKVNHSPHPPPPHPSSYPLISTHTLPHTYQSPFCHQLGAGMAASYWAGYLSVISFITCNSFFFSLCFLRRTWIWRYHSFSEIQRPGSETYFKGKSNKLTTCCAWWQVHACKCIDILLESVLDSMWMHWFSFWVCSWFHVNALIFFLSLFLILCKCIDFLSLFLIPCECKDFLSESVLDSIRMHRFSFSNSESVLDSTWMHRFSF